MKRHGVNLALAHYNYLVLILFMVLTVLVCSPADLIRIPVRAQSKVSDLGPQEPRPTADPKAQTQETNTLANTSELTPLAPPLNDQCAGAEIIPAAGPFPYLTATTDTTEATTTNDPPAPSCAIPPLLRSVWYTWTPSVSAQYIIATCNPPTATTIFDTVIAIYTASGDCTGFVTPAFACNDDDAMGCGTGLQSKITENFVAGTKYYIVVWDLALTPTTGETNVQLVVAKVTPTANESSISGNVADVHGVPIAGATMVISGGASARTVITDGNGHYSVGGLETNGFYTVTPSRANYIFSPAQRSFSLVGNQTDAAFTGSSTGDSANPLDTAEYFVRQQYVDILGREPDEGGFNYWSDQINACNGDAACIRSRRVGVAAAFFIENEFKQTGLFIYDVFSGALGQRPNFAEYSSDRQQVIAGPNLDAEKSAFALSFVQRPEFTAKYQSTTTGESFVDALLQTVAQVSGADLSSQRDALINDYHSGSDVNQSRALVLGDIANNSTFNQAQYNKAFVLVEYFGYLQRNPDQGGYDFWLNVISNREVGNYRGMVCAFITSTEYQQRFSSVVTHTNGECGE